MEEILENYGYLSLGVLLSECKALAEDLKENPHSEQGDYLRVKCLIEIVKITGE